MLQIISCHSEWFLYRLLLPCRDFTKSWKPHISGVSVVSPSSPMKRSRRAQKSNVIRMEIVWLTKSSDCLLHANYITLMRELFELSPLAPPMKIEKKTSEQIYLVCSVRASRWANGTRHWRVRSKSFVYVVSVRRWMQWHLHNESLMNYGSWRWAWNAKWTTKVKWDAPLLYHHFPLIWANVAFGPIRQRHLSIPF